MEQTVLATQRKHENPDLWVDDMETALVIATSTQKAKKGIERALKLGVPVEVIRRKDFREGNGEVNEGRYADAILSICDRFNINLLTLNGCLAPIPEKVVQAFLGKAFNQHPGHTIQAGGKDMFGRRVHCATILAQRIAGVEEPFSPMVAQRLHPEYDKGAVVKAVNVPIQKLDTVDSFQERSLPIEHILQTGLLQDIVRGDVRDIDLDPILVGPGHERILEYAKRAAILLYPEG